MPKTTSPALALVVRLLLWLPLVLLGLAAPPRPAAATALDLSLAKRIAGTSGQTGPFAMPTGQVFTYELHYGWNAAVASKWLEVVDTLPPGVELAGSPGIPNTSFPTTWTSSTTGGQQTLTFSIDTSMSPTAGSGKLTIPVRLVPGSLCASQTARCNHGATIGVPGDPTTVTPMAPPSTDFPDPCVVPVASDRWQTTLRHHHGCACDQKVQFEVAIESPPGGDVGGLDMIDPKLTFTIPNANGATFTGVVRVANFPATTTAAWGSNQVPAGDVTGAGTAALTVDLTGVTLPVGNARTYHLYVEAVFPCAAYATGTATVGATLDYQTPCGPATSRPLGTASIGICAAQTKASVWKSLEFSADPQIPGSVVAPCLCPGCSAWYRVGYANSGTVPIVNPSFEDLLPAGLDATEVRTEVVASWASQVDVVTKATPSGTTSTYSYTTPGWHHEVLATPPTDAVTSVRWTCTGAMPPGETMVAWIRVRNVGGGTASLPDNVLRGDHAPDFALPTPVGPCGPRLFVRKDYLGRACGDLAWQQAVPAGTRVRFCLTVANVGNAPATNVQLVDTLPPGVTYVPGSETYAYHTVSHLPFAPHTVAFCTDFGPAASVAGSTGTILPGAPSGSPQTVTWTIPTLPGRCDGVLEGLQLQFDVDIGASVAPGTYVNRFDAVVDGVATRSNDAPFTVSGVPQWRVEKWVRAVGTTAWAKSVQAAPGAQVEYLLQLHNASNVAVSAPCLVDVMPHPNDDHVLPTPMGGSAYTPRGSTFDLPVAAGSVVTVEHHLGNAATGASTLLATPSATTTWFAPGAASRNPDRNGACLGACGPALQNPAGAATGTWSATGPAPADAFAFQISAPALTLAPNESFVAVVRATVPAGAAGKACNNVAASAVAGGTCARAQTLDPVCVLVDAPTACLEATAGAAVCDGHGGFSWTFAVTNLSGKPVNQLQFPTSGNVVVSPALVPVGPLSHGASATVTVTLSGAGATPGTTVCVPVALGFGNPAVVADRICSKDVCVALPTCGGTDCPGTIVVHKFDDDEGDKDPQGDAGVAGVGFSVQSGSATVASGATGANGIVTFSVPAGSYTVVEALPTGWTSTTGTSQTVVVPAGGAVVVEFGNRKELLRRYDLSVQKAMSPSPLVPGGTAVATITLVNHGPAPCQGPITVTDTWSPSPALTLVSATASPAAGWTLSGSTWTHPGPLPASQQVVFTYTFQVSAKPVEEVRNCARVTSKGNDLVPENDEHCVTVPVGREALADLVVTKRMEPNPLVAGGSGVATITLVNQGPNACPGPISVTDTVTPAGALTLGPVTPPAGWTYAAGVFTWPAANPPLPLGTTVFTVPFQVSPNAPRVVTNCATVRSATKDPRPADNRACVEASVRPSTERFDLAVVKDMSKGPYVVGQTVNATVTVVNKGPGTCPGPVVLRDVWTPSGALALQSMVATQPGWQVNVPAATATLAGPLAPNQPQTFLCTFVVVSTAGTDVVENCAFVPSLRGDVDPSNDRMCVKRSLRGRAGPEAGNAPTPPGGGAPTEETGTICVRTFEDRNGNDRFDGDDRPVPGIPVVFRSATAVRGIERAERPTVVGRTVLRFASAPQTTGADGTVCLTLPVGTVAAVYLADRINWDIKGGGYEWGSPLTVAKAQPTQGLGVTIDLPLRRKATPTPVPAPDPVPTPVPPTRPVPPEGPARPGTAAGPRATARGAGMDPVAGELESLTLTGSDGTTVELARMGQIVLPSTRTTLKAEDVVAVRFRWPLRNETAGARATATLVLKDGRSVPFPGGPDGSLTAFKLRIKGGKRLEWTAGPVLGTPRAMPTSVEIAR